MPRNIETISIVMPAIEVGGEVGYSRKNLYIAACSVYTLFVAVGMVMGWASPSIPKLKEEHHNFTLDQSALLGSITGLAPGPLLTIFGIDTIGRKGTLFVIWSTVFMSPIIMLISTDVYALLVARFIGGIGMGAAFSAIGIYISEISDVGVRNSLNSVSMLFLSLGTLISNSVGPFVPFFVFTIVSLVVSAVFGFLWFFLLESPYYYLGKDNIEKARSSLQRIKVGASSDLIEKELATIQLSIEEERRNKSGLKKLLTSKAVFKQFVVSFYLLYLQQGSGLNPLGSYSQEIFNRAKLDFSGAYVPIGLTLLTAVIMIPLPFVLKRFGNKLLFIMGGFGSGIFMTLLGVYFLFLEANYDLSSIQYLSIVFTFGILLFCYMGLGGIVWGTVSDLFAPSVKGAATGICGIFSTFLGFVATQIFGTLKETIGFGVTFVGFGVVQIIASIGLFFILDTTKMTLQEIQDYFEGNSTKTPENPKKTELPLLQVESKMPSEVR